MHSNRFHLKKDNNQHYKKTPNFIHEKNFNEIFFGLKGQQLLYVTLINHTHIHNWPLQPFSQDY